MREVLIAFGGGLIGLGIGMIIGAYGDWITERKAVSDMARCNGCIHENVCNREVGYGYFECPHFKNTADAVEVVRCKDCSYCVHGYPVKAIGEEALEGWYCRHQKRYMRSDDFCSYGERKEDK